MKNRSRKYTFRLHPGDTRQAICISELDAILQEISNGEVKKGKLSQEITEALFKYFSGMRKKFETDFLNGEQTQQTCRNGPNETESRVEESHSESESANDRDEAEDIKRALISLTLSLPK